MTNAEKETKAKESFDAERKAFEEEKKAFEAEKKALEEQKAIANVEAEIVRPNFVKIRLPLDPVTKNEPVFIAINGTSYAIPRGLEVNVKPEIAEALRLADIQEVYTQEVINEFVQVD